MVDVVNDVMALVVKRDVNVVQHTLTILSQPCTSGIYARYNKQSVEISKSNIGNILPAPLQRACDKPPHPGRPALLLQFILSWLMCECTCTFQAPANFGNNIDMLRRTSRVASGKSDV